MNMIDCTVTITQQLANTLKQNGVTHVGRYLSNSAWKGLSLPEVQTIKQAGLNIISIYETNPTKASYFSKDQGVSDSYAGYKLAQSLGQPEQTTIYFTVDFDAQTKDFANILNYFQGLKDTLKSYKIGCYGSYNVIQLIQSKGLADYYYQTYAWSSGQHAKNIHLFQYKNDITQFGIQCDLNQVENTDCGSWGQVQVSQPASFLTQIQVLCETDIRSEPDHNSGYIQNAHKDQIFNVTQLGNGWYQIAVDDHTKGWIDANNAIDLSKAIPAKTKPYKIQDGQSLTKIAVIFKTTVQNLLILNPNITNPNKIVAGQTIIVPNN